MTESLHGAPETVLWTTVLETWIKDAKRCRTKARAKSLRTACYSAWTASLCAMIDVDYLWFKNQIEGILERKKLTYGAMDPNELCSVMRQNYYRTKSREKKARAK